MKLISLTQGQHAIVDDEDYERFSKFKWQALQLSKGKFYAARSTSKKKEQKTVFMAHDVLSPRMFFVVDHINHQHALDNRRENLRYATPQQNTFNRKANGERQVKGVYWHSQVSKWRAMIRVDGKLHCLGLYENKEDAARAYDDAAEAAFGEFASLNFPRHEPPLSHGFMVHILLTLESLTPNPLDRASFHACLRTHGVSQRLRGFHGKKAEPKLESLTEVHTGNLPLAEVW